MDFIDDLNIIANTREMSKIAAKALEKSANKIGLKFNVKKTKKLLDTETVTGDWTYEKVNEIQYLRVRLNTKNDWSWEIGVRIVKAKGIICIIKAFQIKNIVKNEALHDDIESYFVIYMLSIDDYECNRAKTNYF